MSINVKDIKLTLPDGIEQVGQPVVTGPTTAEVTLRATKQVSSVKVSASYGEESAPVETEEVTSVPVVQFTGLEKTGVEFVGEEITVTATFDKAPHLPFYAVKLTGEGLVEKQAPAVSGSTIVSKYTLPKQKDIACKIVATYNGKTTKEVAFTTKLHDQIFLNMTANPNPVNVNQDVTIVCTFKKDVVDGDKPVMDPAPEGVTLKTDWAKEGKTWKIVYTANTAGKKVFKAQAHKGLGNQTARQVEVTVNAGN